MSNEIDFSCIEEYKKKLEEMGRKGSQLENKALTESAEIILDEMKKTTRFEDRSGKLREGLKVDKPKKVKGIKTVKIGVTKEDNSEIFYAKFLEYGTSRGVVARPFMRPAFEKKRKEALKKMENILRGALKV